MREAKRQRNPESGIPKNVLEVGITADGREVVVNHGNLDLDANGCGYLVFSTKQARNFAGLLEQKCAEIEADPKIAGEDGFEIRKIEIDFARPVIMTTAIQRLLSEVVQAMAKATETDELVHWHSGSGSKPIWNEPHEPTWDDSVYHLETATRERYESEPRTLEQLRKLIRGIPDDKAANVRGFIFRCSVDRVDGVRYFTNGQERFTEDSLIERMSYGLPA